LFRHRAAGSLGASQARQELRQRHAVIDRPSAGAGLFFGSISATRMHFGQSISTVNPARSPTTFGMT
jgi:hypothetical protein